MTLTAARRTREEITVWYDEIVLGELVVDVRVYPDADLVLLEETSETQGSSVIGEIRELVLELNSRYPETMADARVVVFQPPGSTLTRSRYLEWRLAIPAARGWTPVERRELVKRTRDRMLPA
jgi:hypothetical protein